MRKKFRIVVVADRGKGEYIANVMRLSFGKDNVMESQTPEDLYGMIKTLRPTTVIISPYLFFRHKINTADINILRRKLKYRILAIYETEEALQCKDYYKDLNPDKEYFNPTEYLTMVQDIPQLCTNPYQKRKKPLMEQTEENILRIFATCGFRIRMKGAVYLREALFRMYFDPSLHNNGGGAKLYREIAAEQNTTPRIVQRSIQRFLEASLSKQCEDRLREELNIPHFYEFTPINFGHFTQLFNTYYTIRYGDPKILLKSNGRS